MGCGVARPPRAFRVIVSRLALAENFFWSRGLPWLAIFWRAVSRLALAEVFLAMALKFLGWNFLAGRFAGWVWLLVGLWLGGGVAGSGSGLESGVLFLKFF